MNKVLFTALIAVIAISMSFASAEAQDAPPAAPTLESGAITETSIEIEWSEVTGALVYSLYRNGEIIASTGDTSYTDNGLDPYTSYTYHAFSSTALQQSGKSVSLTVTTSPIQTGSFSVTVDGDEATVSFTPLTDGDFTIGYGDLTDTVTIASGDVGLESSTTVQVGYNYDGTVTLSLDGDEFGSIPIRTEPAPPELRAGTITNTTIEILWDAVDGATEYTVYRDNVYQGSRAMPLYLDNTIAPGTYTYRIESHNDVSQTSDSSTLTLSTATFDAPPETDNTDSVTPPTDNTDSVTPPTDNTDSVTPPTDDNDSVTPPTDDNDSVTPPTDDNDSVTPPTDDNDSVTPPTDDNDSVTPPTDDNDSVTPPTDDNDSGAGGIASVTPGTETPKKSGGDSNEWKTKPTFGKHWNNQAVQLVDNGFVFNGIPLTITDNWHTDFDLTSSIIGEDNTVHIKGYATNGLKSVSLSLGVPEIGLKTDAESHIIVNVNRNYASPAGYDIADIVHEQKEGLVNEEMTRVSIDKVKCNISDTTERCFDVTISFVIMAPLSHEVLAINAVDKQRYSTTTYINEGVEFVGESLLAAATHELKQKHGNQNPFETVSLTQQDRRYQVWEDQYGYIWSQNDYGTWLQITRPDIQQRDDLPTSVMTRIHSNFASLVIDEQDRATLIFDSKAIQGILDESFSYDMPLRLDRVSDLTLLESLSIQEMLA